ncbi:MAG TPA: ABC transporter ATP-binding protein [Fimbriimonadaceae bacterium]|nr:ABC transporter ATP-binding protein [Fimbriimonadaceae bacterium]
MSDPTIEIRDLRKQFRLSHTGSIKTALLWWRKRQIEHLEVLRGIDLEVRPGECVAVIGRNGAGKSTMLSLLARVYRPTSGSVIVHGRIAPLLELGAGFHPDLTGIENIFFNGIILGLTRQEIRKRMDEIVAFSELEHHIDAPVRTYSSGMLARLGFSIAMHVDADVLLVDEVLAVGDFEFERKCFAKIDKFKADGGTILFVSHEMPDVRRVATRCVWLSKGVIREEGSPETIIPLYEAGDLAPGVAP